MKNLAFISVALSSLIACSSQQIVLRENELVPAKDASERTQIWAPKTLAISQIQDDRQKPENWVGTADTGLNNKPTPVEFERPVATIVKNQIENELKLRGLKFSSQPDVNLKIHIRELELSETKKGFAPEASICKATMDVVVEPTKETSALKPYRWTGKVSFQSRGNIIDTTKASASTLAGCLNLIVEKMVSNSEFKQTMTR